MTTPPVSPDALLKSPASSPPKLESPQQGQVRLPNVPSPVPPRRGKPLNLSLERFDATIRESLFKRARLSSEPAKKAPAAKKKKRRRRW
jgi:hypothetical protein